MRGLKLLLNRAICLNCASHLLQMRGLKRYDALNMPEYLGRIFYRCMDWNILGNIAHVQDTVASFTDAWIETDRLGNRLWWGLGRIFYRCVDWNLRERRSFFAMPSHLLQMRGLKHFYWFRVRASIGRIFYRCVDWNKVLLMRRLLPRVASFTDAWIETVRMRLYITLIFGRIFYRCVDWNCDEESIVMGIMCRIFYRCVDWNKAS